MIAVIIPIILVISFILVMWFLPTKMIYKVTPLTQIIIFNRCKLNIKNLLRKDWRILEFSHSNLSKAEFNDYKIYIRVSNSKIREWTNDYIHINKEGKILGEKLTDGMKHYEGRHSNKLFNTKE